MSRAHSAAEDADQKAGEEEIDNENQHRCRHHGLRGGAAYTLGAAFGREAVIATYRSNDEAEEKWLAKSLEDVGEVQFLVGAGPILAGGETKQADGDDEAAKESHQVGDDAEEKQHHNS